MTKEKEIRWVGSAYDDLLGFPDEPRRYAGFQLCKIQAGLEPEDWKPFDVVGTGTQESLSGWPLAEISYRCPLKSPQILASPSATATCKLTTGTTAKRKWVTMPKAIFKKKLFS